MVKNKDGSVTTQYTNRKGQTTTHVIDKNGHTVSKSVTGPGTSRGSGGSKGFVPPSDPNNQYTHSSDTAHVYTFVDKNTGKTKTWTTDVSRYDQAQKQAGLGDNYRLKDEISYDPNYMGYGGWSSLKDNSTGRDIAQRTGLDWGNGGISFQDWYNGPDSYSRDRNDEDALKREYERIARLEEEARQAKINAVLNELEGQKTGVNQGYDDMARLNYINRRQSEANLPQAMKAAGLSGGLTESAINGVQTGYLDVLNANEQARQKALRGIDEAEANARLTGDSQIAKEQAQTNMAGLAAWQQSMNQKLQNNQWQSQMAYQKNRDSLEDSRYNARWNYQMDRDALNEERYQDETSRNRELTESNAALSRAKLKAAQGDFSYLRALGYQI